MKHVREVSIGRISVQENWTRGAEEQNLVPALAEATYKSDFRLAVGSAFSNYFTAKREELG